MSFWNYLGRGFKICLLDKQAVQDIINDPECKKNSLILTTIVSVIGALVITGLLWFMITPFGGPSFASSLAALGASGFVSPLITPSLLPAICVGIFIVIWLFTFIGAGLTHLIARMLGGQATIFQYYSIWVVYGLWLGIVSGLLTPIKLIPILGSLISFAYWIYGVIVGVFALRETYKFSTGRAIGVFAIMLALVVAIMVIIMVVGFMSIFSRSYYM